MVGSPTVWFGSITIGVANVMAVDALAAAPVGEPIPTSAAPARANAASVATLLLLP